MGVRDRINAITGVNRNAGIARINRNRIARQMVDRLRQENPLARNLAPSIY